MQDGAQLYAWGTADPMAKDVDHAAEAYVRSLGADKRRHRDVYQVSQRLRETRNATETSHTRPRNISVARFTRQVAHQKETPSVAVECNGPKAAPESVCRLQCRLLQSAANDNRVDWAGLPVNLDLVFSRNQRDKVYVQHLLRKRENQLWRWQHDSPQSCARGNDCPLANDRDAVEAYPQSLSEDKRYYRDVS